MIHPPPLVLIQSLKNVGGILSRILLMAIFKIESRIVRIILNVQMFMKVHEYGEIQMMERVYNYVF